MNIKSSSGTKQSHEPIENVSSFQNFIEVYVIHDVCVIHELILLFTILWCSDHWPYVLDPNNSSKTYIANTNESFKIQMIQEGK